MEGSREHIPVLYEEVLAALQVRPAGRYVDGTVGAAGHAAGILEASTPGGSAPGPRCRSRGCCLCPGRAAPLWQPGNTEGGQLSQHLMAVATSCGFSRVDGVLLDLGLSSRQLASAERGFSFSAPGPLDMRLDPRSGQRAEELINLLPEKELADLLWRYGEERRSRPIARAIVAARPLRTTTELAEVVARAAGRRGRIHPATRTFQALRIAVNDELEALTVALPQARDLLVAGGRLAVIAFHSLEDRLVKRFMVAEAAGCICPPEAPACTCGHRPTLAVVHRRPVRPSDQEVETNPRSRSARLRVAERLPDAMKHP
jgi:16S rRNA (cytosine1402-N4)-methyltransferase